MTSLRDVQLQYELDTDTEAQAHRLKELIASAQKGDADLPRAHALIGRMCGAVQESLERTANETTRGLAAKYKSWLRALPSEVAAVISIRECIRMCSSPETHIHIQDLTSNVGKLWELEVRIRQAEAVNPMYMQKVHDQVKDHATRDRNHLRRLYNVAIERVFKGTIDLGITQAEMMQIGKFGVDACFDAGMIEQVRGVNKNGTTVSYVLSDDVADFLLGYDRDDVRGLISKEDTRMLCEPDPWTNLTDGGYLSLRRKAAAPLLNIRKLRKDARPAVAEAFTAEKMPQVFNAGNYMQSIPFEIHAPARDGTVRVWQSGGNIMGVPSSTPPVKPEFPLGKDWVNPGLRIKELGHAPLTEVEQAEVDTFSSWKRSMAAHYDELREWRGKVREVGAFLRITREAAGPYWFPMYFDSRGRWYYRGVPNPQGSDLAKGVLHFSRKKPLGERGVYWLKVHIANSYGYDKERMDDRARWTEQNWDRICLALDSPEDSPDVWGKDAPWCMFSAAWELREAYRSGNPRTYCTGIPIHMDATCSGLQHFSALLRDPVGGLYVNLTDPQQCGPKQDIYTRVANATLRMIQMDLESTDADVRALAAWCVAVGIPREMAKKPVMTYVYGATLRGSAEHIEMLLNKGILSESGQKWIDPNKSFEYCMYIAKKLFAGIAVAVPAAAAAMQWLKDISRQMPNGKRMTWHTPTGFWVQHDYQEFKDVRVKLNSCGVTHIWVRDWTEGTRAHSMANAISPNFVHALDASHLTMVANTMAREQLDVVAIHDSFGTHPCDVDRMQEIIRKEFVSLYLRPNLLAEFLWEVGAVGEPPQRGDLDIRDVMDSEFMFS